MCRRSCCWNWRTLVTALIGVPVWLVIVAVVTALEWYGVTLGTTDDFEQPGWGHPFVGLVARTHRLEGR